jgi:hypothetical protein
MFWFASSDSAFVANYRSKGWSDEMIRKYLDYRTKRERTIERGRAAFKDSEKSKLYNAEWAWEGRMNAKKMEVRKFANYDEAEKRLKAITGSKLWKELTANKGHKKVELIGKKNVANAATAGVSWGHKIQLDPNHGMDERVLIHELAHSAGNMHHGLSFRLDHIKLVSRFMGREAAKMLKQAYRDFGLKMNMKQKVKTPDEWLTSYNKMMRIRGEG